MNPNKCKNPLGTGLYHLGWAARLASYNCYQSLNGKPIPRKVNEFENRHGVTIKRATQLYIFGKKAPFDFSDQSRMFDLLHFAWSNKIVGTAFTLRVMRYLISNFYGTNKEKHYCQDVMHCVSKSVKRKLSTIKFAA